MTTQETETVETDPPETKAEPATETETVDEVAKWKALSRKNEQRAQENADAKRELDALRKQHESDQERAVREAIENTRAEVIGEVGQERVADAFRLAVAGLNVDIDKLLDGVNVSRFLGDDGSPLRDEIKAWVDEFAHVPEEPTRLDLGQGSRGSQQHTPGLGSSQLERDLKAKLGIT